jgi:hypothetical protein
MERILESHLETEAGLMPYITHGWPRLRTAAKGAARGAVTRLSYTCSVEIREERIAIVFVIPPFERREGWAPTL